MSALGTVMVVISLTNAQAEEMAGSQKVGLDNQRCAVVQTLNNRHQLVYFTQQPFADGAQELAIIALDLSLIHI